MLVQYATKETLYEDLAPTSVCYANCGIYFYVLRLTTVCIFFLVQ